MQSHTHQPPITEGGFAPAVLEGAGWTASRVSWGAIIAGAVTALTIGLMLNALGIGIGATTIDAAARDTPSGGSFGIGAAIWMLVSNLIALGVGGYVAARLSGVADNTDGTLHGVAVWGTMFILSAVLLGNLVAGIASGAGQLVGGLAGGAGSVVAEAGQQVAGRTDPDQVQGLADRAQAALRGNGGDPAAMSPDQRRAEIGTIVTRRVTNGSFAAQDRDRLGALVAAEYGIPQQEAQARVAQMEQQASEAARQAEETARAAADAAARSAAMGAFALVAAMVLSLIAAIIGARRGTRDALAFRARPARL